jgi:nucleoside 2-deoxyribosyltransferase
MKGLYVCGSFKFTREIEELELMLKEENVEYQTSKKADGRGILGCLKKIDHADAVYVVNPKGYVGKSISVDIGYAYAMKKPIYAMHAVDDPPVMDLISEVLRPKELIDFFKDRASSRARASKK